MTAVASAGRGERGAAPAATRSDFAGRSPIVARALAPRSTTTHPLPESSRW